MSVLPRVGVMRLSVAITCAVAACSGTAVAQEAPRDEPRIVVIKEAAPGGELHGVLLRLGTDTATVLIGDEKRELLLKDVLTIDAKGDSVRNGALIGGIIGAVWCAVVCGEGIDNAAEVPLFVAVNAGMSALVGAGIDAMIPGRTPLYRRSQATAAQAAPRVSFYVEVLGATQ